MHLHVVYMTVKFCQCHPEVKVTEAILVFLTILGIFFNLL